MSNPNNPNPQQPPQPSPPPPAKSNKKWLFIGLGCGLLTLLGIVALVVIGIVAAIAIPKIMEEKHRQEEASTYETPVETPEQSASSPADSSTSEVKSLLSQLENGATLYNENQTIAPEDFLDFVSNEELNSGAYTVTFKYAGNPNASPCSITSSSITCSGGTPDSRFPALPGAVIYAFNAGPGTFTLYCDGGISPPLRWDPELCGNPP